METNGKNLIRQHLDMDSLDENGFEMEGANLILQHLELEQLDERGIQKYIGEQIRTMSLIESKIQSTKDKSEKALQKANDAQGEIRAFHKKEAIEKLQQAALAQSEALEEMVKCNTCIFENQKAMAEVSKRLLFLGIGNIARNRLVVKQLSDYLDGMASEDTNSMMRIELFGLVSELNSQLDLMQRVQNISSDLNDFDDAITLVQLDVDETKKTLEEKDKELKALSNSATKMQKDLESKDKTLEALGKDAAETKKALEEKDKALEALSKSAAEIQKDLESKDKTLEVLGKDAAETKKALEEKDKALEALSKSAAEMQKDLEGKDKTLEALGKDAAETKKALEEKDKAMDALSKSAAELQKDLESKDKTLEALSKDAAETKKVLEEKEKALNETKELAEMALKKAGDISKKNTLGMWILGGVIVITAISLALIFGNISL